MLALILKFLAGRLLGPIKTAAAWLFEHPMALLILLLAAAAVWFYWRDTRLAAQLAKSQAAYAAEVAQTKTLRAGIDAQNAGVQRILQQGVANEQAAHQVAAARAAAAQRVRVIYQTRVQRIEAAPVPATCASAAAWAAGQAQGLAAAWGK